MGDMRRFIWQTKRVKNLSDNRKLLLWEKDVSASVC